MGLIKPDGSPLVAGAVYDTPRDAGAGAASILTPAHTGSFGKISDELADKGFLVTSTDDLINWHGPAR